MLQLKAFACTLGACTLELLPRQFSCTLSESSSSVQRSPDAACLCPCCRAVSLQRCLLLGVDDGFPPHPHHSPGAAAFASASLHALISLRQPSPAPPRPSHLTSCHAARLSSLASPVAQLPVRLALTDERALQRRNLTFPTRQPVSLSVRRPFRSPLAFASSFRRAHRAGSRRRTGAHKPKPTRSAPHLDLDPVQREPPDFGNGSASLALA
jgi:hypothetical protein